MEIWAKNRTHTDQPSVFNDSKYTLYNVGSKCSRVNSTKSLKEGVGSGALHEKNASI